MKKYKKITDFKEKKDVALHTMAAADAHRLASISCNNEASKYDSESYNSVILRLVSFELILVSVEQSLRLLLLLRFSIFPERPDHDLFALYKKLQDKGPDEEWIRKEIIQGINNYAQTKKISLILNSEEELVTCLETHQLSYSNIKYFRVNKHGKLNEDIGFSPCESKILHCLAEALTELNTSWLGMLNMTEERLRMYNIPEEELEVLKKRFLPTDT